MARLPKQPKPEFNLDSILNNPVQAKELKGYIEESLIHKRAIANANNGIADIRTEAKDSLGIPPGLFNYLVKTKFKEAEDALEKDQEKVDSADAALTKLYGSSKIVKINASSSTPDLNTGDEDIDGDE
jgi:hypothetical protein